MEFVVKNSELLRCYTAEFFIWQASLICGKMEKWAHNFATSTSTRCKRGSVTNNFALSRDRAAQSMMSSNRTFAVMQVVISLQIIFDLFFFVPSH